MNCAARVKLIEHLTTEHSDTRITQLLPACTGSETRTPVLNI